MYGCQPRIWIARPSRDRLCPGETCLPEVGRDSPRRLNVVTICVYRRHAVDAARCDH